MSAVVFTSNRRSRLPGPTDAEQLNVSLPFSAWRREDRNVKLSDKPKVWFAPNERLCPLTEFEYDSKVAG